MLDIQRGNGYKTHMSQKAKGVSTQLFPGVILRGSSIVLQPNAKIKGFSEKAKVEAKAKAKVEVEAKAKAKVEV